MHNNFPILLHIAEIRFTSTLLILHIFTIFMMVRYLEMPRMSWFSGSLK